MSDKKLLFQGQVLQFIDVCMIVVAFTLAPLLWEHSLVYMADWLGWFHISALAPNLSKHSLAAVFVAGPFVPLSLDLAGFYKKNGKQSVSRVIYQVIKSHFLVALAYSFLSLILNMNIHRPTLIISYALSIIFICARESFLVKRHNRLIKKGEDRIPIMLAGKEEVVADWWSSQNREVTENYKVVTKLFFEGDYLLSLKKELSLHAIERVIFIPTSLPFESVTLAVDECEIQGIDIWLAADFMKTHISKPTFDRIGSVPVLALSSTPPLSWELLTKFVIDKILATLLIIMTLPIWLFAYVGIKIKSPGPVFYRQERAGRYGRSFNILKFRTMDTNADKLLDQLKEQEVNQMSGPVFKLKTDPRIFSFGAFLRKTSIDELPQLLNVIMGDMSLVGPRPMAMYELPNIERSEHRRKLSVRPGITCIWQVEGRNTITDFDEWVALDLQYIDNWSLWLDFKILLKTIPAVCSTSGAS